MIRLKLGSSRTFAKKLDNEADEMRKFIYTLKCFQEFLFGDATYEINKRRQVSLRKPSKLPQEENLMVLRNHLIETMRTMSNEYEFDDLHTYVSLRNSACARLTWLCGRRGGEPARLTIQDWLQAERNEWIDLQRMKDLDELDRVLVKSLKISFMTGKGNNHLVPILIPEDTISAIRKVASKELRELAGVSPENQFLFARVKGSEGHVSGWHVVHNICLQLPLKSPEDLSATKNRQKISTLFAALDVPEEDRRLFYSHMGHSEKVNHDVYQAPLAMQQVTKVGKHLMTIDKGKRFFDFIFT